MIFEINLIVSFIFFCYVLNAGKTYLDGKKYAHSYRMGSVIFKTQPRAIIVSTLGYIYSMTSFGFWAESHWPGSGFPFLAPIMMGLASIPYEVRSMFKQKTSGSPVADLMTSRIEYEFRRSKTSTDTVESMVQSLVRESHSSRDARIAIDRLAKKEDKLGALSRSILDNEK